jgi:sugar phosphate isomerase/epimerase
MKKILLMSLLAAGLLSGCGNKKAEVPGHFCIGFQLYSVRTELAKDFYGTLKRVSDLGYQGVEFYDEFHGHSMTEVKRMCTELGLIPFSNHVPFAKMMNNLDQVIEENTILGVQYITFPYMDTPSRPAVDPEQFKETVARIGEIGAKVRAAGFQLLYHNHDFEFAKLPDGTVGHDYIFSSNDPADLQVQLDICWADFAGHKADELIDKYAGRIPVIHIKDYFLEGEMEGDPYALIGQEDNPAAQNRRNAFEFRPLGTGMMDLPAVIAASAKSGVRWLCVEQDEPAKGVTDRFEGPAVSAAWLKENGLL